MWHVWGRGEERRGVYSISVGISERKKPLVRPRLRCEDDIKINL